MLEYSVRLQVGPGAQKRTDDSMALFPWGRLTGEHHSTFSIISYTLRRELFLQHCVSLNIYIYIYRRYDLVWGGGEAIFVKVNLWT